MWEYNKTVIEPILNNKTKKGETQDQTRFWGVTGGGAESFGKIFVIQQGA